MTDILVRPLSLEDKAQWQKLYHGYANFYKVPMSDDILQTVWSWVFDSMNPFFALVAVKGDQLVGLMHYRAMPSPLRGKMVGFLDDLFVDPEVRGSGVVDSLFVALQHSAKEQGWAFVRWITAETNYRGRAVYDRIATKTAWQTYQLDI